MTVTANILKTLGYFDLFHYPLTAAELRSFSAEPCEEIVFEKGLDELVSTAKVFRVRDFYSLHNDITLADRRTKGNQLAVLHMIRAEKAARWLSAFPFVQSVAVSGSLSKNFATEQTDIDFFIITSSGRLWIARTLMHLFKKFTFLTGRQHWFCMNYYVDEEALEIKEQNFFTAMEVITLVPMQGKYSFDDFLNANAWARAYFPLYRHRANEQTPQRKKPMLSRLLQYILKGSIGDQIDILLMRITGKRWRKKTTRGDTSYNGTRMGMMVDRHFSKPDPRNFQANVLKRYEEKLLELAGASYGFPVLSH